MSDILCEDMAPNYMDDMVSAQQAWYAENLSTMKMAMLYFGVFWQLAAFKKQLLPNNRVQLANDAYEIS